MFINLLFTLFVPGVLWFKSRNDNRFQDFITNFNSYSKLSIFIWRSQFYLLSIYFFCLLISIFLDFKLISNISLVILSLACLVGFVKRKFKLYNSIEEIYEAISELVLILYIIDFRNAAWIISLSVLCSSVSAGLSKLKSNLWKFNGSRTGFIQFLTLPSVSRKNVRRFSSYIYNKYKYARLILDTFTIFFPWIQIISGLGLLITKIIGNIIFMKIFFAFQLGFIFILYIISDLSWITSFYLFLILATFGIDIQFNNFYLIEIFAALFLIIFSIKIFSNKLRNPSKINKLFSILTFNVVPFKVFTDAHMTNIITHYIETNNNKKEYYINAFDKNGHRSIVQNHISRHTQALMYPLGDFCINFYKKKSLKILYKSELHEKQCNKIFNNLDDFKIIFFQHSFSQKKGCYISKKIASLKCSSEVNPQNFEFHSFNPMLKTFR